jgi:drug/metabolite transporter (DMT)-like permease
LTGAIDALPFQPVVRMTRNSATLMLLAAAFFWGSGNVANKTVLDHVGPLTAVGFRCLIAAIVVVPWAVADMRGSAGTGWLGSAMVVSILFCTAMVLQQSAFQTATVTNASFLVNTCSILTPIVAWVALRERPPLCVFCAAAVTLIGAFLMTGGRFSVANLNQGDLLCLTSAFFYAAWMVALGRHIALYGLPFATSLVQFAMSAAILLPLSGMIETQSLVGLTAAAPQLLGLGLFSTGAAFVLQTWAQQTVSSSTAAIIVSAESLFGAIGAYLWLGEQTSPMGVGGAALILSGIMIAAIGARADDPAITAGQCRLRSNHQTAPKQHPQTQRR